MGKSPTFFSTPKRLVDTHANYNHSHITNNITHISIHNLTLSAHTHHICIYENNNQPHTIHLFRINLFCRICGAYIENSHRLNREMYYCKLRLLTIRCGVSMHSMHYLLILRRKVTFWRSSCFTCKFIY